MHPILIAVLQTSGVVALAVLGAFTGRWLAGQKRLWHAGYALPLAVVALVSMPRWSPMLALSHPFRLFMLDRLIFVGMALVAPVLLSTLAFRLPKPRERKAVLAFMGLFVVYFSVIPFIAPALAHHELSHLETRIAPHGVCLQTTDYTCGPAAAVTVLLARGASADESSLALAAHANAFFGSSYGDLSAAMNTRSPTVFRAEAFKSAQGLRGKTPCIAVVKFNLMVDHYVAVLDVTDTEVEIGDPINGWQVLPVAEFEARWRFTAIVPE